MPASALRGGAFCLVKYLLCKALEGEKKNDINPLPNGEAAFEW